MPFGERWQTSKGLNDKEKKILWLAPALHEQAADASFPMNISSATTSLTRPAAKPAGTAARDTGGQTSDDVTKDFLTYARMSPMERMRANILKSMDLTEEQIESLPQDKRQTIEDQIKDTIRKMVSDDGRKGQLVTISA